MHFVERTFQLPLDAPPRVLADIAHYSAFVEFQAKMAGASAWYQKLN